MNWTTMDGFVQRLLRGLSVQQPRVLVAGMPKSGTTAVAMLLGVASGLRVVSDPFNRLDEAGVSFRDDLYAGALSLDDLVRRHPRFFRGGLVKDPNFVFFPDEVQEVFPRARLVFVIRDPRDNIRSILNRLQLPGRPEQASHGFEEINDAWRRVLQGRTPEIEGADYVERLARRWVIAAENYARQDGVQVVRYDTFNARKADTIKRTLTAMGLQGDHPIDHLLDRQFQPRGERDTVWEEFFGHRVLQSIECICGAQMENYGFTLRTSAA